MYVLLLWVHSAAKTQHAVLTEMSPSLLMAAFGITLANTRNGKGECKAVFQQGAGKAQTITSAEDRVTAQ